MDVAVWLEGLGLGRYAQAFADNDVDAAGGIDWEAHMVDGTSVRAHRCAAGGKGGRGAKHWAGAGVGSAASCT